MQRRDFSAGLLAAGALSLAPAAFAQKAGTDYRVLSQSAPVEAPAGKIEVVEFFWYSCPHCNAFEPQLEAWSKKLPADVVLRRVPVAFRDDFVPQQRLFYTLEAMNRLDLHGKVFDAIHKERQPLNRDDTILAWAQKSGLDRAKFQELYASFSVQTKARRASQLQDAYRVEGVPALGVAGRFYVDGESAGNMGRALQIVDALVAQVRQGR
ncbi:thiol:disulfide interchange protein DsbA/DsbL [Ramlibacter sp. MAHUQ-53]|uniref:thiol:disulfide interchange protein DsbA/DsbL n=1 Tax=unclassified Ramlibacter TaxID=2617605 RepID=UPI003636C8D2